MTSNIIPTTAVARDGRAASRVGGTHGTHAAHQSEPNLGRSAPSFVKMNKQQMRNDSYLARYGVNWIIAALAAILAGVGWAIILGNAVEAAAYVAVNY